MGFLSKIFNCKGPNFERLMTRFITVASSLLHKSIVESVEKLFTFYSMFKRKKTFRTFQAARYATGVCFHQSYRPTGLIKEAQPWYSESTSSMDQNPRLPYRLRPLYIIQ